MTNDESLVDLASILFFNRSSFTASALASSFLSLDTWRCADWPQCGSAPAQPSPDRNLRVRLLFSGCWSGNGTDGPRDRKGSARPTRNRADRLGTRASRLPPR